MNAALTAPQTAADLDPTASPDTAPAGDSGVSTAMTLKRPNRRGSGRRGTKGKDDLEFDGFARRMVAAYGRRAATADPAVLATLVKLDEAVDEATAQAVCILHARGFSWAEIAAPLGIARQHAHRNWGDRAAAFERTPEGQAFAPPK